jgi:hypothetical protein
MSNPNEELTDYIGIDLDVERHDPLRMLMVYYNARHLYPNYPVEVRTTRKGFHVKIWKQATVKEDIEVRRNLGDDPMRLWYSEQHIQWGLPNHMIDVLYEGKKNKYRQTYTKVIEIK